MKRNKVALFVSPENQKKFAPEIRKISGILGKAGLDMVFYKEDEEKVLKGCKVLLTLGGVGTILRGSLVAARNNLFVLGISKGYLGFLSEIALEQLGEALKKFFSGEFSTDKRNFLKIKMEKQTSYALNELALKSSHIKMMELEVYLNDMYLTNYKADGLIVSTPTGSTAYNLSAGGPIIFPDTEVITITPICSHALTVRSLVVSAGDVITIRPKGPDIYAMIDGRETCNVKEEKIQVSFSKREVRFVRFSRQSFIDGLRNKLNWSGKI
ncbi:MAG: NAD(+)/NADH kinase [Candidatus Margulisbacteria bacterium]|nr:NAD(+)/NADH kinase [Candidatus Margulisiibacteriota bacterium]